jgi:SAM-dependent methyltransferase
VSTIRERLSRIARRLGLRRSGYPRQTWSVRERVEYLERVVDYLTWQTSNQAMLLRHLAAPVIRDLSLMAETRESFDFQWDQIPTGRSMFQNERFREEALANVCRFTLLPAEWFPGKTVFDVGCGLGRYSWALCRLGAEVLSLDQSEHGLARTAEACRDFPGHRTMKIDLLEPLPTTERADLVWCFGVLHHTGDTYKAFRHVASLVKPGGFLYLMLYGEPRPLFAYDYDELNEYEYWRRRTMSLGLREKLDVVRDNVRRKSFLMTGDDTVHGYFDAISPRINDLYSFEEIESWLRSAGFTGIRRTVEARNHHVIAQRVHA